MSDGANDGNKVDLTAVGDESLTGDFHLRRFDRRASLSVATGVMYIFGGVYALAFLGLFGMLWLRDATFDKAADLVKFLVQLLIPLVTLAVGYYLGDRGREIHEAAPRKPPAKRIRKQ